MAMSLIQGTISGLKAAGEIAKGILDLKTMTEVQGKVIELQSTILSAQSSALSANAEQAAMVEEIRALNDEIARVKAWETEKQRYVLYAPWQGSVVYALRQSKSNSEPPHWLCTSCHEDGRKSILNQDIGKDGWGGLNCPVCKSHVRSPWRNVSPLAYADE